MVGDSVTLDSNASEIELRSEIEWRFNGILIAKVIMGNLTYHDYTRFKDRLTLARNGSLTIKDSRVTDTGGYELSITSNRESVKRFSVTVYAPLSIPVVTSDISQCSSGSECSLLCSVVNVEYQEKNSYSCVINNPISNKTKHVCITDLCRLCSVPSSDEVHYGGGTEPVIRLVVTAVVGLAAVAAFIVLVYDIRSRRDEQDQ
ncbi:SLAM family member 5-like [Carassius auratus]|uniref:SLAM family member 5-like n=1 Tax=Carassius auratus TaxID=7957 RepID=A0A6P6NME4_CARAU|nr:SLAM family member 5-like [Carassius auratus]